jgi:outer membrane receptor protein involved in Fe transport
MTVWYKNIIAGSCSVIALAGVTGISGAAAQQSATADRVNNVSEVIMVTATRREASIQDVPVALSAISAATLQDMGARGLEDFYRTIPNLAVVDRGAGRRQYSIRGISAGVVSQGAATVGVYIDEMPVSATGLQPDLSVYDLERIEVLRGPQGTLFGEGSLGGTIRYITPTPDPDAFDARVNVDLSSTKNGGFNNAFDAMVNVPLWENAALRVTGYRRDYDGFIDLIGNPAGFTMDVGALVGAPGAFAPILMSGPIEARDDINDEEIYGGRASFYWEPTENLSLKLSYLFQRADYDGRNTEIGGLGNLQSDLFVPEVVGDDFDLANMTVTWDFGFATLLSSTSLYERDRRQVSDTAALGGQVFPGLVLFGTATDTVDFQEQFSQEVRLTSKSGGLFEWTAGFFYVDKDDGFTQVLIDDEDTFVSFANILFRDVIGSFPMPPFPLTDRRQILDQMGTFGETQYALYGEGTVNITDQLSATFGIRYYDYEQTDSVTNNNINILGLGLADGVFPADDSGVNLKFNVSYKATDDLLFYVTAAEGFRIGGTNTAPGTPAQNIAYNPDSLWNYELGTKFTFADGRASLNAAIYYVDWSDIQLSLPLGFSFGVVNAGEARVIGGEIELMVQPTDGLDFTLAIGLNDGQLTADAPSANDPGNPNPGFDGDRLPGTPAVNVASSAQYTFPVADYEGFARIDYSYTGGSTTTFNENSVAGNGDSSFFELDGYHLINLQAGMNFGKVTASVYAENLTDTRANLLTDNASAVVRITRNRPRTIGIRLSYEH